MLAARIESLCYCPRVRPVHIIGVPLDLGGNRRGVDMGPSAMRYAGVIERLERLHYHIEDLGDIPIGKAERLSEQGDPRLRNLKAVAEANEQLAAAVDEVVQRGRFPLVLGGDHSIAIGTLAEIVIDCIEVGRRSDERRQWRRTLLLVG